MTSVDLSDSGSHFLHFILCNVLGYVNAAWGSVWVAIIDEIWKHKNNYIFKDGTINHFEIFSLAQLKTWSWTTSYSVCVSFSHWCFDLLTCLMPI